MPESQNLPLTIAHRGSSALAPENTFAAFQKAIDDGADGIEFDVRLARDGVPVVFHDENLKRTAGRPERIANLTSAELLEIDVGSWFNHAFPKRSREEYSKETIKTLAETLEFLSDFPGRIYIELKCAAADNLKARNSKELTVEDTETLTAAVCELIHDSPLLPQIIVKSFTLAAIPIVRKLCPNARTAALFEPTWRTVLLKQKHIIDLALEAGAHELSIHHTLATRRLCNLAARQNVPVTIWTVDNPKWLNRAQRLGVHALITNVPNGFSILIEKSVRADFAR